MIIASRYALLALSIPIALVCGLSLVDVIASIEPQSLPPVVQTDNTGLWIALISTLGLAIVTAITSTINTVLNYKIKMAQIRTEHKVDRTQEKIDRTEKKVDENTELTKKTARAVNGELEDRLKLERRDAHAQGFREGAESSLS